MGMGGGVASATRISPESSMRGHGGYNVDYRSYNRGGFGRGQSRQFQRSQPPPQRGGDIFIEAGRLATEFLVSKGLLPANVLSGKWQNDSSKNQVGTQEGDGVHTLEGRSSALSRLGGPIADIGPGHRRHPDDYDPIGSRSNPRGRRRNGSFKNNGCDREFGRSGSWSEKSRPSADAEGDSDAFSRPPDEQQVGNDGDGASQSSHSEFVPGGDVGDTESALEKQKSVDDAGAIAGSSSNCNDISMDAAVEPPEKTDVFKIPHVEAGEIKDSESNDEMELQDTKNEQEVVAGPEEDKIVSNYSGDLLKLCSFAKIPTRPRSSMASRGSKVDADPMLVDKNTHENEPPKQSLIEDSTVDNLSGNDYPYVSKILDSSGSKTEAVEDGSKAEAAEDGSGITCDLVQGNGGSSISSLDRSSVQEEINELPALGRTGDLMDRGEKRASDEDLNVKASKIPRESVSSEDAQSDGSLHISDSLDKNQAPQAPMTSEVEAVTLPADEKRLLDISLYPKGDIEPCMEYAEEKELFPGSFKTCDLNLMESSHVNENRVNDPILMFPSIPASGNQAVPVEIDLTISNNSCVSDKYGKDIEVIDLENDSVQEDKDFNNVQRT